MDLPTVPLELMSVASTLLLLLLSSNMLLDFEAPHDTEEDDANVFRSIAETTEQSALDMQIATRAALHNFRLYNVFSFLEEDLGYWVKPRSTAWFSRFLLEQYDDERWISIFRMTKPAVLSLAELLKPAVQKKDTRYRLAIPVVVRLACTLFKLSHGASLFICSEMFAIGRSTVSLVLREVVQAINDTLRSEISWPTGYPLLPWLMVPHRGEGNMPIADSLFNKKLRRGRGVVENAFGILKITFRELLVKSDLQVTFLPDIITCCAILHNMLLGQSHGEVETLLQVLRTEGLDDTTANDHGGILEIDEAVRDDCSLVEGMDKRRQLGIFLALQRNVAS